MVYFGRLFLFNPIFCAVLIVAWHAVIAPAAAQPAPNDGTALKFSTIDRLSFADQLRQELYKNPTLYQGLRNVVRLPNGRTAEHEIMNFNDRASFRAALEIFTPTVTAEIKTPFSGVAPGELRASKEVLNAQTLVRLYDGYLNNQADALRAEMQYRPDELNTVIDTATTLAFRRAAGEQLTPPQQIIADFYTESLRKRQSNLPVPTPFLDRLNLDPNAADTLARLGIEASVIADLRAGRITAAEVLDPIDRNEIMNVFQLQFMELNNNITQNTVNINTRITPARANSLGLSDVRDKLTSLQDTLATGDLTTEERALVEEQINNLETREQDILLKAHRSDVVQLRDAAAAVSAVSQLLFPDLAPEVQKAKSAFDAGLQIYDAVGSMLIGGLSTGGVASVAIGISSILGLFNDPGISADEIIIDQLNEVLANQREILQQLTRIEGKVDVIDQNIRRLIEITNLTRDEMRANFIQIDADLREIQRALTLGTELAYEIASEQILGPVFGDVFSALTIFEPGSPLADRYLTCFEDRGVCPYSDIEQVFLEMDFLRARLLSFLIPDDLRAPDNILTAEWATRASTLTFPNMSLEQTDSFIARPAEDRFAALPQMLTWLNSHKSQGLIEADVVTVQPVQSLAHPVYLSTLTDAYATLGNALPSNPGLSDTGARRFHRLTERQLAASAYLRTPEVLKLAQDVFHFYARKTNAEILDLLSDHATVLPNDDIFPNTPGFNGGWIVPFASRPVSEQKALFEALDNRDLMIYALRLDLVTTSSRETARVRLRNYTAPALSNRDFGTGRPITTLGDFLTEEQYRLLLQLTGLGNVSRLDSYVLPQVGFEEDLVTETSFVMPSAEAINRGLFPDDFNSFEMPWDKGSFVQARQALGQWRLRYPATAECLSSRVREPLFCTPANYIAGLLPGFTWRKETRSQTPISPEGWDKEREAIIQAILIVIAEEHEKVRQLWLIRESRESVIRDLATAMFTVDTVLRLGFGDALFTDPDLEPLRSWYAQTIGQYVEYTTAFTAPRNLQHVGEIWLPLSRSFRRRQAQLLDRFLASDWIASDGVRDLVGMGFPALSVDAFRTISIYDSTVLDETGGSSLRLAIDPSRDVKEAIDLALVAISNIKR